MEDILIYWTLHRGLFRGRETIKGTGLQWISWNLDDENAVIRLFVSVPIDGTIEISSDYIAISDN